MVAKACGIPAPGRWVASKPAAIGFIEQARDKNLPWSSARVFQSRIRRNIKLAECPSFGQHILRYESASHGAADYRALAREVLEVYGMSPPIRVELRLEMAGFTLPATMA